MIVLAHIRDGSLWKMADNYPSVIAAANHVAVARWVRAFQLRGASGVALVRSCEIVALSEHRTGGEL